ncbi:MAG: histidine kinase [Clostridia bacterium]|nr:histidine kinase [Clostridia bacterium]
MSTLQYIHFSIEIWGALFCLISVFSVFITRHFDPKGARKLIVLLLCAMLLMVSDSLAWIFRGNISEAGYYIVRIANYCAFFFGFLTMPLVAEYISHLISERSGIPGLYWKYIEWALFIIGTGLITANIFHEFIYSFDERNTYFRLAYGVLPGIIAFTGIIITLGVVLQYIGYMNKFEKAAMIMFLVLPNVAVIIQILHYGVSFTNLSLVLSTFLLFVSYEFDYMQFNTEKERKLAEERIRLINQQVQPHFIFNTLSVIRHLCKNAPDEAADAINEFSGYLRGCTDFLNETECIPAEREFDLVKHYIYLEQKRFGKSITVNYDITDTDFGVPPFAVQTVVENAIKHGLRSQNITDGLISVASYTDSGYHIVEIKDNGAGFDTDILKDTTQKTHVGIKNTAERLRLMCGGSIDVKSEPGKGTQVTIKIPKE